MFLKERKKGDQLLSVKLLAAGKRCQGSVRGLEKHILYTFLCVLVVQTVKSSRLDQILLAGEDIWLKMRVKNMKSTWVEKFENCCSGQNSEGPLCICRLLHDILTFLWEIN